MSERREVIISGLIISGLAPFLDVCLGIVYPKPPLKKGLRQFIEKYLEVNYGVPAYWFNEIKSNTEK